MQTVKEAWDALNAGKTLTDGVHDIHYTDGQLFCDPDDSIIPFHVDNIEDWEVVVEVGQLYCRWYHEEKGFIKIGTVFYTVEKEPMENWIRMEEAFTREEILGI